MAQRQSRTTTNAATSNKVGSFIEFVAEIKQVSTTKTASLDLVHKVVLISDNELVNTLGLVDADSLVKVRVEVVS